MRLIGNKSTIALEYSVVGIDNNLGYSKIWLGDSSIGTIEDLIYIKGYVYDQLVIIINTPEISFNIKYLGFKEIYNTLEKKLNSDIDSSHKYLAHFGTFCDDFTVFTFIQNDFIFFIWKLHTNNTPFEDLNIQTMKVQWYKISLKDYVGFVEKVGVIFGNGSN